MKNEIIYLELDEEITSVIDRLRSAKTAAVGLVVPRGSTLAQSIINLKLLKKSAEGLKKTILLISSDNITSNLASQTGLSVFSKVTDAENAVIEEGLSDDSSDDYESDGIHIHNYTDRIQDDEDVEDDSEEVDDEENLEDEDVDTDEDESDDLDNDKEDREQKRDDSKSKPESKDRDNSKSERKEARSNETKDDQDDEEAIDFDNDANISDGLTDELTDQDEPVFNKKQITQSPNKPNMKKPKSIGGSRKPLAIIFSSLFVLTLVASYIFIPYASAKIILSVEDFNFEGDVTVDSNNEAINVDKGILPGKMIDVTKESTKKFSATGKKDVGTKATGKITVYNSWDSTPQKLAAGSKFVSDGKTFVSTEAVTIPGLIIQAGVPKPGSISVNVEAMENGNSYNLAPTSFVISSLSKDKQDTESGIYGKSTTAFSGGTTKSVSIVTDDDIAKAEDSLKLELTDATKNELQDQAKDDVSVYTDKSVTTEVLSSVSSAKAGAESSDFDLTMKIKSSALTFSETDILNIVQEKVNQEMGSGKMLVSPDKSEVKYDVLESQSSGTALKLSVGYTGKVAAKLDEKSLIDQIKNKNLSSAESAIKSNVGVKSVEFKVTPNFLSRTPVLSQRITVSLDFE